MGPLTQLFRKAIRRMQSTPAKLPAEGLLNLRTNQNYESAFDRVGPFFVQMGN
jgi:hypothetical protein